MKRLRVAAAPLRGPLFEATFYTISADFDMMPLLSGTATWIEMAMFQRGSLAAFSPPDDASGDAGSARREGYLLLPREWEDLNDVAMSFHGVMRLIKEHGFDNSTGAEELLQLVYREYEKALSRIRRRMEGEDEEP